MLEPARTRRPRRAGEWTEAKAVTFIVTLAASRSVTLAASRAGMSRKSAYSLKRRDACFAAAWNAALTAIRGPALNSVEGGKADEGYGPPVRRRKGYSGTVPPDRSDDEKSRDRYFAGLANRASDSHAARLARARPLP